MVNKQVFWLQVSVEVILLVHVAQCLQGLEHYIPDHILREQLLTLFHQLVHIHIKKFKDEMQGIALEHHLVQLHDVWMGQLH
jgi:hypothetical protein